MRRDTYVSSLPYETLNPVEDAFAFINIVSNSFQVSGMTVLVIFVICKAWSGKHLERRSPVYFLLERQIFIYQISEATKHENNNGKQN